MERIAEFFDSSWELLGTFLKKYKYNIALMRSALFYFLLGKYEKSLMKLHKLFPLKPRFNLNELKTEFKIKDKKFAIF